MARDTFDEALRRLLMSEGGYSNHPSDPGGPTNFGITIGDYRKYIKPAATASDVRAMKIEEAKDIYRAKYWGAMRCDTLPAGLDYCLFDYAVNSGTGRVPKVLQRLLGVAVSGRMDDATVSATNAREPRALISAVCDERLRFLKGLKTWPVFGAGWSRRVGEVRAAGLAMADKSARRVPIRTDNQATPCTGKGVVPVNESARKGAAGGVIATGGVSAQQAAQGGADWIVIALIVLATIAATTGAWLFWRWRQRRQQHAPA